MPSKFHQSFEEGLYYHVYNRTNDKALLFRCKENYRYFLRRYHHYMDPVVDTPAYCLMPTHFHFLVRVKEGLHARIEERFRRFFISYVKALNKMYSRHGSLFQKPFNRTLIQTEHNLLRTICYIHHNPIHHGCSFEFGIWEFCSYRQWIEGTAKDHGQSCATAMKSLFPHENWESLHREFDAAYVPEILDTLV
ncbi:MAG TPA: hypothetical protein VFX48_07645 [Saprospiraceae bacterium]|nr:hypothetical protein [Saprospiraceae bacterium]